MYNLYLAKWHKLPNKKGFFNKINELLGNDWICKIVMPKTISKNIADLV